MTIRLTELHTYPVKSMRGVPASSAVVEPWGLTGDRRWMIVDTAGECVTAREHPALLLLTPSLADGGLWLHGPGVDSLFVPVPAEADMLVSVHGREPFLASDGGPAAEEWLSAYVGTPVRLAYADDPTRRSLNPRFARPDDSAAFNDAYPILVTTLESLEQLNAWIADGPRSEEGPMTMTRFRPNVVVSGAPAFSEDSWRKVRIGDALFRSPKGCDRCVMTTTDPDTAARGKEPITTLARHRRFDGATWFGMNLIPDNPGATIRVGDEVEILETENSDGPPR
ncbi:MOSC domain-containing protein [Nocardioides sp. Kera G14]|uniref:MOSC domain-containing protein n=1 Tax=Nocardioides sp. Kera G14 TaxID=2884264 RepID=UPI001D104E5A|nr:MOSC N-terminal beta barrel domain-containing protein [Nocardioides sp. Kera G14]UDY22872.1 MOSC domain-containing protein [Nocardioides sp. Kera G14]